MTNLMIRIVTLATCSIALIAAFSVTPVVAAGGSDLGGGEADYGHSAGQDTCQPQGAEALSSRPDQGSSTCVGAGLLQCIQAKLHNA